MQEDTSSDPHPNLADKERAMNAWEAAIDARWRRLATRAAALAASEHATAAALALVEDALQRTQAATDLRAGMLEQRSTHARILDAHASEAELLLERARLASVPQRPTPPPLPAARQIAIECAIASSEGTAAPDAITVPPHRPRPTPPPIVATAATPAAPTAPPAPDAMAAKAPDPAAKPGSSIRTGIERRGHRRVALDVDVTLASEHNFFVGFTENISEGGLFIATHQLMPVGSVIDVTFRLPAGEPIHIKAAVQWVRQFNANSDTWPGLGVSFLDMSDTDRATVNAFLAVRDPLFHA